MFDGDRTDFTAVEKYLYELKPRGTKLGIHRMRPLAAALGHPEAATPCIHIAGTNGKGSVAAMIDSVLRASGWKVGLYTSPHLVDLGERIQVNRRPLSRPAILEYTHTLDAVSDEIARQGNREDRPSFFEFITAMAFLEFQQAKCDIAVIEVGLGGEFDATNIVTPELSVITSIGLDHCEWLGSAITDIARAKAGILKERRPAVIGRLSPEAERVIRKIAEARSVSVTSVRAHYGDNLTAYPTTNLAGDYQRLNAAAAVLALERLGEQWHIDAGSIEAGLHAVYWPGRWERTRVGGRILILDAAHNAEAAAMLDENLAALVAETGRAPLVIMGALGLERARPLLSAICRHAAEIHLVVPQEPRSLPHDVLESCVPTEYSGKIVRAEVAELFPGGDTCTLGNSDDVIVVTGSIYLLGEVMSRCHRTAEHGPVPT
jgi:dihydrofolate synthase/folylpolyglutamate synthase